MVMLTSAVAVIAAAFILIILSAIVIARFTRMLKMK